MRSKFSGQGGANPFCNWRGRHLSVLQHPGDQEGAWESGGDKKWAGTYGMHDAGTDRLRRFRGEV